MLLVGLFQISRAFTLPGKMRPDEAVQATLSSLLDQVVDIMGVTSLSSEDPISERKSKLEFLEMQEELITEEDKAQEERAREIESSRAESGVALNEMDDLNYERSTTS